MITILAYFGHFLLLVNMLICFSFFYNKERTYNVFFFYLSCVFCIQVLVSALKVLGVNNLFLSHYYFIFQFVLLSYFYLLILKNELQKKIVLVCFFLCLLSLCLQYILNSSLFKVFNLFEVFITSFLLIVYSSFHLFNQLDRVKKFYYINLGILIYLFGSTVLFLVGNLMLKFDLKYNKVPWVLNSLLYIVYQLFILYEWKLELSKTNKSS